MTKLKIETTLKDILNDIRSEIQYTGAFAERANIKKKLDWYLERIDNIKLRK